MPPTTARSAPLRHAALAVVLGVVVAGCGTTSEPGPVTDEAAPAADLGPTAGDPEVVLRYGSGGGLLPPLVQATSRSRLVLYGDGRLEQEVTPSGGGSGRPAVPTIEERQLDADDVAVIADLVEEAGVTEERDYGFPPINDAGADVLQVRVDGEMVVNGVEAPGFEDDLSSDELKERARFERLVAESTDLDATLGPDAPEPVVAEFDRWLAFSENDADPTEVDSEPFPATVQWPLDATRVADDAEPSVCTELTGTDVDAVLRAAADADEGMIWTVAGGGFVRLGLQPVTEDQTCAGVAYFVTR